MVSRLSQRWTGTVPPEWKVTVAGAVSPETTAPVPSLHSADEAELVRAAVGGSSAALDVLVERHRRSIYQLCYRYVGNHEDASDLAQDVFVRACRSLARFKGHASLRTWLYRIAVNVCLNRVTAKRLVTEPIEETRHVDRRAVDPGRALLRAEQQARVRAAIARLPNRQRAVLVLRVYQELPHQEIARIVGSSVGAVKANFFHALGNLRKLLATP
jgi:RNA polymerase sigma-70 factor, ECF subfamily